MAVQQVMMLIWVMDKAGDEITTDSTDSASEGDSFAAVMNLPMPVNDLGMV